MVANGLAVWTFIFFTHKNNIHHFKTNNMINKVTLLGRVGNDPEIKKFDNGQVANFSLATTERGFTSKDGKVIPEKTEWHKIVVWGGLSKVVENYIKKGSQLYVEGKLQTRSWEGKDGAKMYVTEIFADNIQMLGGKNEQSGQVNPAEHPKTPSEATEDNVNPEEKKEDSVLLSEEPTDDSNNLPF